jgi:hypothetical protein
MRGHRLLFVLASVAALGVVGFAGFADDRNAVVDFEAAQLVGGACEYWTPVNCLAPCKGSCLCGSGSSGSFYGQGIGGGICGGGSNNTCGFITNSVNPCTG